MTIAITERDQTAEAHSNRYQYTRIVEIAGRIVRATIKRDFYVDYSLAYVEMINDHKSWTQLADEPAVNWWHTTPHPHPHIPAAEVLGAVTDRLLHRAADIIAPPPTALNLSPRVLDAVSALLATAYGYDAQHHIDPDDIAWAANHGGALHIIEHPDGSVTFTKAHRDECPFIVSKGSQDCDDECSFDFPHRELSVRRR
jgi:hypothetical protein